MFEFDESKVPEVELVESWTLQDGTPYSIYRAGDWDFEYFISEEVDDIKLSENAIYAWIAWKNWLEAKNEG
jgi:hypothetical protein